MPPALGAVALGAGLAYSANRASKAASQQAAMANRSADLATLPRSTQYGSYVNPGLGISEIDPSIRSMRERAIANVPTYQSILNPQLQSTIQGLGQTRGRLESLYGDSGNAFLDPVLQRLARARGELVQNLTDRGLGGSSLYSQALGNFESEAAPGIAQAALQGRRSILGDLSNIDTQTLAATSAGIADLQNLDNLYASVAGQNLQQELSALGLSQADIGAILGAANQIGQAGQLKSDAYGRALDVFGRVLGGFGGSQVAV